MDAVKPQGGKSQAHVLKALVDAGIPTASHIGLTPHTVAMFGGFRIQGRTADAAMKILEDALAIQDAGCFMLEFEAVPAKIATVISRELEIPTIGIGAGSGTDGQILLSYDLLGVFTDFKPKFTKRYANVTEVAVAGLKAYVAEVKAGAFPDDDHSYGVDDKEYDKFLGLVQKRRHACSARRPRAPDNGTAMTLTERAYTALEEMIVRLELAPGGAVSEAMLCRAARHRPHADPRSLAATRARASGSDPAPARRDRLRHQREGAAEAARGAARGRAPGGAQRGAPGDAGRA